MAKQTANIYEIAREAGVSIATVSRVINGSAPVSEENLRKVTAVIEKLHYVPNATARLLSTSSSDCVSVVVPDINNPFFSGLLQGITRVADEAGFHIFLSNTDESPQREHQTLDFLRQSPLRGIIITPVSEKDEQTLTRLRDFEARGIPVVLLDREVDDASFDRVVTNDEEGTYRAVCALLRCGHERIAMITGPEDSRPGRERLRGYQRALREAGLAVVPEYLRRGDFKSQRAYEQTLALCALPQPPTAVFTSNNLTTYGCLRALNECGLAVGRDIALIGFDNIEALRWLNYRISAVDRDVPHMGEEAMRLLRQRLSSEAEPHTGVCVELPTSLLLRGSEKWNGETRV